MLIKKPLKLPRRRLRKPRDRQKRPRKELEDNEKKERIQEYDSLGGDCSNSDSSSPPGASERSQRDALIDRLQRLVAENKNNRGD